MDPNQSQQQFNQFNQPDPSTKVGNELGARRPGEQVIFEMQRHPIGILGIYVAIVVLNLVIAILAMIVFPSALGESFKSTATTIGSLVFLVMLIFSAGIGVIATKVYWANKWVLTSDSITQVQQTSLFNRESSQISLNNIENVSAEQNGIIQQVFKFGTLRTETAGQVENFVFPFCSNPNYYATRILETKEAFEMMPHTSGLHHNGQVYDPNVGAYTNQPSVGQAMPPEPQNHPQPVTNPVPPTVTTTQEDQTKSQNFKTNY